MMMDVDYHLIGGDDNIAVCSRLDKIHQVPANGRTGLVNFAMKLVQPNDSWCNYTWWAPTGGHTMQLYYVVLERGYYSIGSAEFDVNTTYRSTHCRQEIWRYFYYKLRKGHISSGVCPAPDLQRPPFRHVPCE